RVRLVAERAEESVALPEVGSAGTYKDAAPVSVRIGSTVHLDVAGRSVAFELASPPDIDQAVRAAATRGTAGGASQIVAPMPGAVLAVHRTVGDLVEAGDAMVTLEAMKMEHVVGAPLPGRVVEILVHPADQVVRGQRLAVVEP
ncbi:MAG TPA: biotin/lipoyl-containing protein, partial [Candidatus Acidoferrum sp.]|nr:biotin/lipoyl-containing protein [Candidatus Acidoferrum sp.]